MTTKPAKEPKSRLRLLVSIAAVVLTFAIMAIFFWNFFYQSIVQPLYNLYVLIRYGINSIPQGIYHIVIIMTCLFIALWSIAQTFTRGRNPQNGSITDSLDIESQDVESRYQFWRLETRNLRYSKFARDDFARNARRLILNILAHQEHLPYEEVEDLAESDMLKLPQPITDLIHTRSLDTKQKSDQKHTSLSRQIAESLGFFRQKPDPFVEEKVNAIITFIEQRLEIVHHE